MSVHDERDRGLQDVTAAVRELVELMRNNGLAKVDVVAGDVSIKLQAVGAGQTAPIVVTATKENQPPAPVEPAEEPKGHLVTAPMIGTFYTSPSPGDPPFVQVGDHVDAGQIIGIIEAMKIMNEISADRSGIVAEFLVSNAQAVEYGSPLLRVMPEESSA
jgi:acetyl-CoA carboxylase biotin carboxyl carrier protein